MATALHAAVEWPCARAHARTRMGRALSAVGRTRRRGLSAGRSARVGGCAAAFRWKSVITMAFGLQVVESGPTWVEISPGWGRAHLISGRSRAKFGRAQLHAPRHRFKLGRLKYMRLQENVSVHTVAKLQVSPPPFVDVAMTAFEGIMQVIQFGRAQSWSTSDQSLDAVAPQPASIASRKTDPISL